MKIQCSVCEAAEATILCCADEASLCCDCDQKVHSANKLVSKHQRVLLSTSSSQMPKCDICQETVGYFFCLEDRSLLCRRCDTSTHKANQLVSKHQRFLLTGVRVGLEATLPRRPSSSSERNVPAEKTTLAVPQKGTTSAVSKPSQHCANPCDVQASDLPLSNAHQQVGPSAEAGSPWQQQLNQYVEFGDFSEDYAFVYNNASSEVQSDRLLGNSDRPSIVEPVKENERVGQMPDTFWAVPQVPSLRTSSEQYLPESSYHTQSETAFYVPDIRSSHLDSIGRQRQTSNASSAKRRRQY